MWLAEGLLAYLEPSAVRLLLKRVDELSAPSSRFLADTSSRDMLGNVNTVCRPGF